MSVVDSIPEWLSISRPAAEDAAKADPAAVASPSLPFTSDIPHPTSHIDSSPFPDIDPLADTLLAKIAAGNECLAAIASYHHIPYPRFTLWLLQSATQERLAALSVAIASAARLTATAALPDIVRGLKSTLEQLNSHAFVAVALPGADPLRAQALTLRRHRAAISASALIYRISRFTCPSPHPRSPHPTSPKGEVRPKTGVGAPAFSPDFPTDSSSSSSSSSNPKSQIQNPKSESPDLSPMPIDEATQTLIEELQLTDDQAVDFRADPRAWLREHLHEFTDIPFIFDDAHNADDG